jgi:sterol desaturase/sphingolipid hydroxylase (fatty acid hydroxylase superfamily)
LGAASNIYWLYLFSAFGFATLLYVFKLTNLKDEKPLLEYLFPKQIYLHSSLINQCKHYFVTSWYFIFVSIPESDLIRKYAQEITYQTLTTITGTSTLFEIKTPQLVHYVAFTIFLLLTFDFGLFLAHYTVHKIPFLWEFHKVHHSAEVLTPVTSFFMHPVDLFIMDTIVFFISSIGRGIWIYIFGSEMQELLIYEVNLGMFIFSLGGNLQHSHFWVSYPYWISHILISPAQHQIHHSVDQKHWDKNFGTMLSLWDWMSGSLYVPCSYEELDLGLTDGESKLFNSVTNSFLQPFRTIWQSNRKTSVCSQLNDKNQAGQDSSMGRTISSR